MPISIPLVRWFLIFFYILIEENIFLFPVYAPLPRRLFSQALDRFGIKVVNTLAAFNQYFGNKHHYYYVIKQLFNESVGNRSNYFSWGTGKDQKCSIARGQRPRAMEHFGISQYREKIAWSIAALTYK